MKTVLKMKNITKEFSGVVANNNITLELRENEVHAILGENGAGKSTLMSILYGLYTPTSGEIIINGEVVHLKGPQHANEIGIGMVHQHFKLVKTFTVLENIILGMEDTKNLAVDLSKARDRVIELSKEYKLEVDPDAYIKEITVGMQQRVEILKMLYRDADILIFDEPTAVLTPQQIEDLMQIIKNFKNLGKSILLITHKLDEIMSVADRCSVLRQGELVDTLDIEKTTKEELSRLMVGRDIDSSLTREETSQKDVVFNVSNLNLKSKTGKHKLNDISFDVKKGEVLCIAGIDGNGQTELIHSITGLRMDYEGSISFLNEEIGDLSIRERTIKGISHIPEDRHKHGLVLDYPLEYNFILQEYFTDKFQEKGRLKFDAIREYAEELIKNYDVRSGQGAVSKTRGLSGGNQQKAILAREMSKDYDLLIAVQPTRGLDVGAIEFVHKRIIEARNAGKAVLVSSLELDEVMNLSDRIIVLFEGEVVANVKPSDVTVEELGLYMSGAKRGAGY